MSLEKEIESISPLLMRAQGEPFAAPDGYYDQLAASVQAELNHHAPPAKSWFSTPVFRPALAGAVGLLMIIGIANSPSYVSAPAEGVAMDIYTDQIEEDLILEELAMLPPPTADADLDEYLLDYTDEWLLTDDL